jgi:hypothetical protein
MATPKHLKLWEHPEYYIGECWPDYYSAGVGQSRDSAALETSNFRSMLKALGGESETVIVVRESHWAVGWVEWIAIHSTDEKALEIADRLRGGMEDYPVIDESDFSEVEDEQCNVVWTECMDIRERVEYFRRHSWSRYAPQGETVFGCLRAAIKGSWYHAANLLKCPSDLSY